jgi:hypothetical protein
MRKYNLKKSTLNKVNISHYYKLSIMHNVRVTTIHIINQLYANHLHF